MRADGLRGFFQRIRRVGIHLAITGVKRAPGGMHQIGGSLKLRHHSVNWRCAQMQCSHSFTFAYGSMDRISKIEMAGMNLMNRKNSRVKKRSEEHTSELQSLTNLVCRLLLEKKKKE